MMRTSTPRARARALPLLFVLLACLPATGCGVLIEAAFEALDDDHCRSRCVVVEPRRCYK